MTPGSIGDSAAWRYVLENHVSGQVSRDAQNKINGGTNDD